MHNAVVVATGEAYQIDEYEPGKFLVRIPMETVIDGVEYAGSTTSAREPASRRLLGQSDAHRGSDSVPVGRSSGIRGKARSQHCRGGRAFSLPSTLRMGAPRHSMPKEGEQ